MLEPYKDGYIHLFVDAGARKRGDIYFAVAVVTDMWGNLVWKKFFPNKTNQQGEGIAIAAALWQVEPGKPKHIYSDSLTAVGWTNKGKCRNKKLPDWYHNLAKFLNHLAGRDQCIVEWVPREQNLAGFYIEEKYPSNKKRYVTGNGDIVYR